MQGKYLDAKQNLADAKELSKLIKPPTEIDEYGFDFTAVKIEMERREIDKQNDDLQLE